MTPTQLLHIEMRGFFYGLAAVVAYQILTRRIRVGGLLTVKTSRKSTRPETVSPGRVQLLLATIVVCISYLNQVAHTTTGKLPDVSNEMLYVFGGSSGIYSLTKLWSTFKDKLKLS